MSVCFRSLGLSCHTTQVCVFCFSVVVVCLCTLKGGLMQTKKHSENTLTLLCVVGAICAFPLHCSCDTPVVFVSCGVSGWEWGMRLKRFHLRCRHDYPIPMQWSCSCLPSSSLSCTTTPMFFFFLFFSLSSTLFPFYFYYYFFSFLFVVAFVFPSLSISFALSFLSSHSTSS